MSAESILEKNKIPITKNLELVGATKGINCLAWDKSGARIISGSSDHKIRMYDFGGMTADHEPFQ